MKVMSKSIIIEKNAENNIIIEKDILSNIKSKFITNMKCAFQDFNKLYLVLQLMQGGDLKFHLNHFVGFFPEKMIKFLIVNITLCLAVIHNNGIVHRDIKPENFLFDNNGYLHLTDFNSAVYLNEENEKNNILNNFEFNKNSEEQIRIKNINQKLVGTLGYIAPEYILAIEDKISFASDFYSFGVIIYELMFKKKPYIGDARYIIGEQMLNNEIDFNSEHKYSDRLKNFVRDLLEINPGKRLGFSKGYNDLKLHDYLYDLNWEKFFEQKYESPFVDLIEWHKKEIHYEKKDDVELFDFVNSKTITNNNEKQLLDLIESDPNFLNIFFDYNYIYFDNNDFRGVIKGMDKSLLIKNNPKRKINIIYDYDKSSSSCQSSRTNSNGSNYNFKHKEEDDNHYFVKKKIKKQVVYLPLILKQKQQYYYPKLDPRFIIDSYKYNIHKFRNKLEKLKEQKMQLEKEINNEHKSDKNSEQKSEKKSEKKEKTDYHPKRYKSRKKLIFNNYYNPMNNNNAVLNPSLSMINLGQMPQQYPYVNRIDNLINYKNHNYSSISSSETYDELFGKKENISFKNNNEKNTKRTIRKKEKEKTKKEKLKEENKKSK